MPNVNACAVRGSQTLTQTSCHLEATNTEKIKRGCVHSAWQPDAHTCTIQATQFMHRVILDTLQIAGMQDVRCTEHWCYGGRPGQQKHGLHVLRASSIQSSACSA